MNALEALCTQVLADPLGPARAAAARGQAVIGLSGEDLPVELAYAAGAFPVRLPMPPGRATPLAERYLESGFLPAHRALVQLWLEGAFDFMSAVLFSRASDSAQRLYYYLCELQRTGVARGPRPLLYDLAKIPRPISLAHTERATRRLAGALKADAAALDAAIARANRRRALWGALDAARCGPAPPEGAWAMRVLRAAGYCEAEAFDAALAAALKGSFPAGSGPRVQLIGSSPPDERLHAAIGAAGARVVQDIGECALAPLARVPEPHADPLTALARHYHRLNYGPRAWEDYVAQVLAGLQAAHIEAAVLWLIEEDEALAWHVPALCAALAERAIPLLCLTRQRWDASAAALEPLGAFIRTLGGGA